jgi:hypothetical protein
LEKYEDKMSNIPISQDEAEAILKHQMGNYIAIYRPLLLVFGPVDGIYLNEIINYHEQVKQHGRLQEDGSFYFTHTKIEDRVGFNQQHQSKILNRMKELGTITTKLKGLPARNYFTIHFDTILHIIKDAANNSQLRPTAYLVTPYGVPNKVNLKESNLIELDNNTEHSLQYHSLTYDTPVGMSGSMMIERKKTLSLNNEPSTRQRYRKDVLDLIKYWNNSPGLAKHKTPYLTKEGYSTPTKTFTDLVNLIGNIIDGKYTIYKKPYSKEDIIIAIDRFKLAATNPAYYPTNKGGIKGVNMLNFFFNPYAQKCSSNFLKYVEEEPKLIAMATLKAEEDKNPQMTIWLKQAYFSKILSCEVPVLDPVNENKFVRGANLLQATIVKLQKQLNMMTRPIEWCGYVIDALINRWGKDEVKIGHIGSEYTYYDILVRYLKKKGRIN